MKFVNRHNTNSVKWNVCKDINQVPMWIADGDYMTAKNVIVALKKRVNEGVFGYDVIPNDAYQAVIDFMKKRHNIDLKENKIIFSLGVVFSLFLAIITYTKENDGVTILTPVYNPFHETIIKTKRTLLESPLINKNMYYNIDFKDLELKLSKSKMLIMCNPHNPVGRVFDKFELENILKLCKKYRVMIVSDEMHGDITYGKEHYSFCHFFNEYDKIVVLTSPSKAFNIPGLKISNVFIHDDIICEEFKKTIDMMHFGGPDSLAITALTACYNYGAPWLDKTLNFLKRNANYAVKYINENLKDVRVIVPEGTYLLWLDFTYLNKSSDELWNYFYNKGVVLSKGSIYGSDGYMRLNIATSKENLVNGLKKLCDAAKEIEENYEH